MTNPIKALEAQLAAAVENPQQIDLMNILAWELRYNDPQRGLMLSQQAYELAADTGSETSSYQKGMIESLRNLGYFNSRLGNHDAALSQLFEALSLSETLNDLSAQLKVLRNIGMTYRRLANYPEALAYYFKALKIAEDIGDQQERANTLDTLGTGYLHSGDYSQALSAYQNSLEIFQEIGDRDGEAWAFNDLAMAYLYAGDYDNALIHGQNSLQIAQEIGNKTLEVYVLDTLGQIALKKNEYQQALTYLQQSAILSRKMGLRYIEPESLLSIGKIYMMQQQVDDALSHLYQALKLAEEMDEKSNIFQCHQLLAEIYKQQGDLERALRHHEQFHAVKEAVFNQEADTKLKTLQVIHETENAKKEAEIYQLKNVALEQEITERKRAEEELRAAQAEIVRLEKETLEIQMAGGFAHEIRNALTGNIVVLDAVLKDGKTLCQKNSEELGKLFRMLEDYIPNERWEDVIDVMEFVDKNEEIMDNVFKVMSECSTRALDVTSLILDYAKLGHTKIGNERVHVQDVLTSLVREHRSAFAEQGIALRTSGSVERELVGHDTHIYSILNNLILNAYDALLEVTDDRKRIIEIVIDETDQQQTVSVRDNANGIAEEHLKRIYEPFFSTKPSTGTGLGLNFVSKLVMLYHGKIDVESKIGKGTTFTVTFPIYRSER